MKRARGIDLRHPAARGRGSGRRLLAGGALCFLWAGVLQPVGGDEKRPPASPSTTVSPFQAKYASAWAKGLLDPDRARRREAADALLAGGMEAVPVLVALLLHAKPDVRKQGEEILSQIGPGVVPAVIGLLASRDANVRYHAVCVLRDLGPDAAEAVPLLARSLSDNHRPVAAAVPDAGTDRAIEMAVPDGSTGAAIEPAVPDASTELTIEPAVPEASAEPSIEPATTYASVELVVETEVAFEEEIPPQADPEGGSGAPAAEDVRSPEDDPLPTPERSDQS